jgi:hypothetical protein
MTFVDDLASLSQPWDPLDPWEARWAPYDEATHAAVLAAIQPDDVVLEIGAGDLRLAQRLARIAQRVIAWEQDLRVLAQADPRVRELPNLQVACTDARCEPVPEGVTVAVLLMRHCTHFALYVRKLRDAGCQRLITNARWRTGVELIDLAVGVPFDNQRTGWYACRRCGGIGFQGDEPDQVSEDTLQQVADVEGCPNCQ